MRVALLFHPLLVFLVAHVTTYVLFLLTSREYFRNVLEAPKGNEVMSAILLLGTLLLFGSGYCVSLAFSQLSRRQWPDRPPWFSLANLARALFVLSIFGFLYTALSAGINLNSFSPGRFNQVKDLFYENYNPVTALRIVFLSGWAVLFYAYTLLGRLPLPTFALGIVASGLAFVLNSSRLTMLVLIITFLVIALRNSRVNVRTVGKLLGAALVVVGVFVGGTYLRDAGAASGQGSDYVRNFLGYFATPYAYAPQVAAHCDPVLAPQQVFLAPVLEVLPEGLAAPLMPNAYSRCNLRAFYNDSFTVVSLPGELYLRSGSWVIAMLVIFIYGITAGVNYRLYLVRHPAGLLSYPIFVAGLLDSFRMMTFTTNILFTNWVLLILIGLACARGRVRFDRRAGASHHA